MALIWSRILQVGLQLERRSGCRECSSPWSGALLAEALARNGRSASRSLRPAAPTSSSASNFGEKRAGLDGLARVELQVFRQDDAVDRATKRRRVEIELEVSSPPARQPATWRAATCAPASSPSPRGAVRLGEGLRASGAASSSSVSMRVLSSCAIGCPFVTCSPSRTRMRSTRPPHFRHHDGARCCGITHASAVHLVQLRIKRSDRASERR